MALAPWTVKRQLMVGTAALLTHGLERVGDRAPDLLGRLEAVAFVGFGLGVFEEPMTHLGVVFGAGSP